MKLNGIRIKRVNSTIFIPLPRELWVETDGCCCRYCSATGKTSEKAYWDTLAVSTDPNYKHTWTVHYPELHGVKPKRRAA